MYTCADTPRPVPINKWQSKLFAEQSYYQRAREFHMQASCLIKNGSQAFGLQSGEIKCDITIK